MATATGKSFPFRYLFIAIGLIIFLILLLLVSTPSILSSRWGQNQIIGYINNQIPGSIELQHLNVSWFGNQHIKGLVLKDPTGNVVASLDNLDTDSPLIELVRGDFINTKLTLNGLNATLEQNKSGISNFHQALGITDSDSDQNAVPLEIQIKDVNATISMSGKDNPMLVRIKGQTSYGNTQGSFEVNAEAAGLTSDKIEKMDIIITNLPIALADEFIALENLQRRGLLMAALGDTLNVTLIQSKAENGMNVTLEVNSAQLTASLDGKIVGDQFSLNKPGKVSFAMQPAFLEQAAGYQSQKVLPLEMTVDKLDFPLSNGPTTKADMAIRGTLDRIPFDLGLNVDGSKVIVEMKGDRLQGHLPLQIDGDIALTEPGYIQANITPERYQAIHRYFTGKGHLGDLELVKPSKIRVDLKEFRLPRSGLANASINAEIVLDQLSIDDVKTGRQIDFNTVSIAVNSALIRKRVDFSIRNPEINLKGYVQNPYDYKNMIFATQGSFKNLPAGVICEFACFESKTRMKVESLLGSQVDGTINVLLTEWNGPIRANIGGSNGRFDLDGNVTNGILTLNKPFTAEVKPTPELGQSLLEDLIPILSGLVSGTDRIKLYVSQEGFSMPIDNFDLISTQIGSLSLDLGRVKFTNEGELGKIMSALKARPGEYIDVWFTPIYISASHGVINMSRFDFLAMQRYHIAAWGQVNVPYDRINMTIGLSGASLSKALGVKIPDKNYMMQFPLEGSIGHARIDKSKVMVKLAAIGTSIAGGPPGMVIGAVLGLATGTLTEPAAPSPTTQPFPWHEDDISNQSTGSQDDSRDQNPVKGMKKEASKLLKNIFR